MESMLHPPCLSPNGPLKDRLWVDVWSEVVKDSEGKPVMSYGKVRTAFWSRLPTGNAQIRGRGSMRLWPESIQ